TKDVRQGAIELLFFVLPFGLLAVALARLVWSRTWVLALYVQLVLMALVFAVIGIVQYESRDIFWNPKVRVDNAYAPSGWFYRVNSVFYDPSIYGRFLVVAVERDERPVDPRLQGRQGGRAASADRRRRRRVPARVRRPDASAREGSEGRGVAHDADHGRRRDGAAGPRAAARARRHGAD